MNTIPTPRQAEAVLAESAALNPGNWVRHSQAVGHAARTIAGEHPDLDANLAYVLGLLHDIGRRAGPSDMYHILEAG